MTDAPLPDPGWHPDPWNEAPWRWWDGREWTGYVRLQLPAPTTSGGRRDVHLEGTRTVLLAGPQHYDKALRKIVKRTREVDGRVPFTATLVREPRNKHDRNAVAVQHRGRTVGYFPKDEAAKYRDALDALSPATITADGIIYRGHKGGSYWSVGVRMPRPQKMPN